MIFDSDQVNALVPQALLNEARNALDLETISSLKIDKRGRIEAAVKPAPPSKEPSSYVKITRRGADKVIVECRRHGKGPWCLHAAILALYDSGYTYQAPKTKRPPSPTETVKLGYRLVFTCTREVGVFKIQAQSTAQYVQHPERFLSKEADLLEVSTRARELVEDVADPHPDRFEVARTELASVLTAIGLEKLHTPSGEKYRVEATAPPTPMVNVEIRGSVIHWHSDTSMPADCVMLPGRPGYTVSGTNIQIYPYYLPDFQALNLGGGDSGELNLTPATLRPLLKEKHQVRWQGPRPYLLNNMDGLGLSLEPMGRELNGRIGLWHEGLFFPLNDFEARQQILRSGKHILLLSLSSMDITKLHNEAHALRLPWQGSAFSIREHMAGDFLQSFDPPDHWLVDGEKAHHWFGVERLELERSWDSDGTPGYQVGGEPFSHQELMDGLMAGGQGVRLSNGRILNVDCEPIIAADHLMKGVNAIHENPIKARHLLHRLLPEAPPAAVDMPAPEIPAYWKGLLRPYQMEGLIWLLGNHAAGEPSLLADDMGLGKTVQTLAYLQCIKGDGPRLVVVPKTLLGNWRDECEKFTPDLKLTIHHGPKRATEAEALVESDLILTTYGTVRQDIDLLYDIEFQVVVLDEAQAIKNPASQTARAVCELWRRHALALSGTPIENRLTELWSIFKFLAPGYLGDEDDIKAITHPGTPGFNALKIKLAPFLKRRLKTEVERDLPPKQEITIKMPLTNIQERLYRGMLAADRAEIGGQGKTNTIAILTKLLRLRQICCHPGLVEEAARGETSNKFKFVLESLNEIVAEGHAALVFSQFTQLLQLLKFELEEQDLEYLYLDGQTTNRQDLVKRFQEGGPSIFLISLKAGGTGLNLTRASYVYHLDPWWNPMAQAQATDRAHRIGQDKSVVSYKLISEGTIEEKILKLQANKKFLAEGLWNEPEKILAGMSHEELLDLFT